MAPLERLPLFPLPTVLLPGATQALHIFEPRYRRLLSDTTAGSREFGVILRTPDQAERAIAPGTAGCVARLEHAQELPDGRSNIVVTGVTRFALSRFVDDPAPYLVAEVEAITDAEEPAESQAPLASELRSLFQRVAHSARTIQDDAAALPELPIDPGELSFAVARYIDLEQGEQQALLASRSANARLARLCQRLRDIVESIELRAVVHSRARGNGSGTTA